MESNTESNTKSNTHNLIENLRKAQVINTDVSLSATLDAVSTIGSSQLDPVDIWCGTLRRPWVVIKSSALEKELTELNKSISELGEITRGLKSKNTF